jgi:hypothetical protein
MGIPSIRWQTLSYGQVTFLRQQRFFRIKWVSNYLGSASILLAITGQAIVHHGLFLHLQ